MEEQILILASGKCSWGKCYACGWGQLEAPVNVERLKKQVQEKITTSAPVKIFASGSFLDDDQFPREFRKWFVDFLKQKHVTQLTIESRTEFITPQNLADFKGIKTIVAIGMESSDNTVLEKYQKGMTIEDYDRAVKILHDNGYLARAYVMVNMPFSSVEQFKESARHAIKTADYVVLINTYPHSKAKLFDLWIKGEWKPLSRKEFEQQVAEFKDNPKVKIDYENITFTPKFEQDKQEKIVGATIESLKHPYFEVWQDYFQRIYEKPEHKTIALFLPCSFRKPYQSSQTHKAIDKILRQSSSYPRIHKIVVSTPGVVPFEFNTKYPFTHYDWPEWEETPEVKKAYIEVNKERVKKYLQNHNYEKVLCYYKPTSETYKAVKQACDELGIKLTNLLSDDVYELVADMKNPIARPEALANMRKNLFNIQS